MIPRFPCNVMMDPRLKWVGYDGPMVLNIGAGINPIQGALNADGIQKEGIDVVMDVREPWPFDQQAFDKVLGFHVLEHIPIEKALHFFQESHRVLKPAGLLILECPDMVGMAKDFVNGNWGEIRRIYASDREPGDQHRWGYDASSMSTLAMVTGFLQCITKPGTDYHSGQIPTVRLEAVRG